MILNVARAKLSFSFQSLIITTSSDEMVKLGHSETWKRFQTWTESHKPWDQSIFCLSFLCVRSLYPFLSLPNIFLETISFEEGLRTTCVLSFHELSLNESLFKYIYIIAMSVSKA